MARTVTEDVNVILNGQQYKLEKGDKIRIVTENADPNQLFMTNAITRAHVAEDLNDYVESLSIYEDDMPHIPPFAPNDDRLTDQICKTYAAGLGEIDDDDDAIAELQYKILVMLGYGGELPADRPHPAPMR